MWRWACWWNPFSIEIWIVPKCKPYTLCCCNVQSCCQIDQSMVIPCISSVCCWHCQSSGWLPVLPSILPSALLPLFSLTNSLLHLSCNFVCQLECQISQSACVLCHSQGHEDESAVSWCQPEGLGLQPNGGWTQWVQVGPQFTFTHCNTNSYLLLSQSDFQTWHGRWCFFWKHLTTAFLRVFITTIGGHHVLYNLIML